MPRYKYVGEGPAFIPDVPIMAQPGQEFDSPVELNSSSLQPVNGKKPASTEEAS